MILKNGFFFVFIFFLNYRSARIQVQIWKFFLNLTNNLFYIHTL
nr:MAG TPA: hypothetical protein [Caudoviricetes sp.]